jgi:hypothetical protein
MPSFPEFTTISYPFSSKKKKVFTQWRQNRAWGVGGPMQLALSLYLLLQALFFLAAAAM